MTDAKKQVIYATIYSFGSKFFAYLLLLVFANLYAPEEYGLGNFAYNLRNILMLFAFIGLPEALIPFLVKKKRVEPIIKQIVIFTGLATLVGLFFIFLEGLGYWILPLVITLPIIMLTSIATAILRSKEQYKQTYVAGFYSMIVTLVVAYAMKDFGSFAVATAYSAGNLCAFFITSAPVRRDLIEMFRNSIKYKKKSSQIKFYSLFAIGIALANSSLVLMYWITSTALGLARNFTQIAQFGVASALSSILTIIPISLSIFIITKASQIKDGGSNSMLARATRISFFITLLSAILLVTFTPIILKIFFPKYLGIEIYTTILIFGSLCFASSYIIYSYHIGIMKLRKVIIPILVGLIMHLLISFIFVHNLRLEGILITQSAIQLGILVYMAGSQHITRITLAAILSMPLFWIAYQSMILGIILTIAITPLAIFVRIIDKHDLKIILKTFRDIVKRKRS